MMPARRLGARTLGHAGFPQVARVAAEPRDRTRGRAFSARKNGQTNSRSAFPGNPRSNVDWLEHRRRMREELTPRTPSISRDCPRLIVGAREPAGVRSGRKGPSRFSLRRASRAVHDAPTDAHFIHVEAEPLALLERETRAGAVVLTKTPSKPQTLFKPRLSSHTAPCEERLGLDDSAVYDRFGFKQLRAEDGSTQNAVQTAPFIKTSNAFQTAPFLSTLRRLRSVLGLDNCAV